LLSKKAIIIDIMRCDLSIIIVNYNVRAFLEQCLLAIERARHNLSIEIFVVDNASVDGSQAMVKKKFPDVHLIENRENIGFSRANNQALKQARGKYILILNPDTLIQEDTILVLRNFLDKHPKTGAVGCKLINPDGSFQIQSRRSLPTPWVAFTRVVGLSKILPKSRLFGRYNLTFLDPDCECEVDVLSGSLMMVRKSVLNEIGFFDEAYFMYGEDIDLCDRIKRAGWRVFYTPKTKAIHYKGESTKKGKISYITHFYSAMLIFIKKNFKSRYSIFLQIFLTAGIYLRATVAFFHQGLQILAHPFLDFVLIVACQMLAIKLRLPQLPLFRYLPVIIYYSFVWLGAIYLFGAYHKSGRYHTRPIIVGGITALLINSTFTYFFKQFAYSSIAIYISVLFIFIALSLWRFVCRFIGPLSVREPLSKMRRAIIVGAGKEGKRILKRLRTSPDKHYEVCGFVDFASESVGQVIDGTEVLSTIENLTEVIRVENIDDVIFSSDRLSNAQILETIALAQHTGVNFRIVPHQLEYIVAKSSVDEIDSPPLLDIVKGSDPIDLIIKRLLDILLSLVIIILTAPLVLVNLIIGARLEKKKIYHHGKETINIYTFKGGLKFLKTIPLYLSVFTGDLSMVGSEIVDVQAKDFYAIYKPGITGLVQIKEKEKGKNLALKERDYYNLYYIKNRSIITDLHIILKSII